jgi:hypothetical protein
MDETLITYAERFSNKRPLVSHEYTSTVGFLAPCAGQEE